MQNDIYRGWMANSIPSVLRDADTLEVVNTLDNLQEPVRYSVIRDMANLEAYKPYVRRSIIKYCNSLDNIVSFFQVYWSLGKIPLSNQVKKGLSAALENIPVEQYQSLSKENKAVFLRLLGLVHPRLDLKGIL